MESWKRYLSLKANSEDLVIWSKEQEINWELFEDSPENDKQYSDYFGFYFVWMKKDDGFKFNVAAFLDKSKSWVNPKSQWGETSDRYERIPKLLKIKFDYYEYGARQLRKYLVENSDQVNEDTEKDIIDEFFLKTRKGWA